MANLWRVGGDNSGGNITALFYLSGEPVVIVNYTTTVPLTDQTAGPLPRAAEGIVVGAIFLVPSATRQKR